MNTMMNRAMGRARRLGSLQGILFAVLLVAAPRFAAGGEPPADAKADKPAATGLELIVDPAAEPVLALKYHLLPARVSELVQRHDRTDVSGVVSLRLRLAVRHRRPRSAFDPASRRPENAELLSAAGAQGPL